MTRDLPDMIKTHNKKHFLCSTKSLTRKLSKIFHRINRKLNWVARVARVLDKHFPSRRQHVAANKVPEKQFSFSQLRSQIKLCSSLLFKNEFNSIVCEMKMLVQTSWKRRNRQFSFIGTSPLLDVAHLLQSYWINRRVDGWRELLLEKNERIL